ncbi:MAG: hypothetical protein AB2A00_37340 [Myxococcota bacterium]
MKTSLLLALGILPGLALAASPSLGELRADFPVTLALGAADGPDATSTAIRVLKTGEKARTLRTFQHAPGMVPRGVWDAQRKVLWLLVPDGESRLGEPARLWRVGDDGKADVVREGLRAQQRPALASDGSVVVFGGGPETETDATPWRVYRVSSDGTARMVMEQHASWVMPVGGDALLGACVLVQDGRNADVRCMRDGRDTVDLAFTHELLRDVSVDERHVVLLRSSRGNSVVSRVNHRTRVEENLDTQTLPLAAPIMRAGMVAWSDPAGVVLWKDGDRWLRASPTGTRQVPVEMSADGSVLIAREDSVDARGLADARRPARFLVQDLLRGKDGELRAGAPVVEIYGVARGGRR